jgi:hypothetical protein
MVDSLVPIAAKAVLGIVGLWLLGRRVRSVIHKRKFLREQRQAGRLVSLTPTERRKYTLEMTVVVSVLGIFVFFGLFLLAAMLGAPAWVGWAMGGLIFLSGIVAVITEGLFL